VRLCYVLLSPTWGMHQYTADLANRQQASGDEVHLVTTRRAPRGHYSPGLSAHTPVAARDRGFSWDALRPRELRDLLATVRALAPDVVHVTGPHLWNVWLLAALRRLRIPTVHTLHDLHPHAGATYGRLLYVWNGWIRRLADHLLVHGRRYRDELVDLGVPASRLTCTLLTHLFVSYATACRLGSEPPDVRYEPWALFLGRLAPYKGLNILVEAAKRLGDRRLSVVIAGPGESRRLIPQPVPGNVELCPGFVGDDDAVDLFRNCGMLVLPYIEASQSALVAAAYFFRKPVIVTRAGALPEYVQEGGTGWIIPPGDPASLAAAMEEGLRNPEKLARMGEDGRLWYEFQRQVEGRALQAMYAQLLAQEGAQGRTTG
jgi:starch synthase